jgi:hypothetical protein
MAAPRNKLRSKQNDRKPWPNEVLGILLGGFGLLLLLSLVSFSSSDPSIFQFMGGADSDADGELVGKNWIGPVGANVAYIVFALFGAAAYLLALTLMWMGVAKLVMNARAPWYTWAGCGVFILSAAA